MADKKIKISLRPAGPDFIWASFLDNIVDPLMKSGLLQVDTGATTHHVSHLSILQNGEWRREYLGKTGCVMLAEFAQGLGMPMIVEDGEPFYLIEEKDAVIQFLKHGDRTY